jgi:hypothetical protein
VVGAFLTGGVGLLNFGMKKCEMKWHGDNADFETTEDRVFTAML